MANVSLILQVHLVPADPEKYAEDEGVPAVEPSIATDWAWFQDAEKAGRVYNEISKRLAEARNSGEVD